MMRSHTTVVLAMSADGKIADYRRSPARFGSAADKAHLERQIAHADAVLFGADTLRAYGTTLRVTHPDLVQQRHDQGKSLQPVHIVCSRSGQIDRSYSFFQQPVPRWLLTTTQGATHWDDNESFERVMIAPQTNLPQTGSFDWQEILRQLAIAGLTRVVVSGGGTLVASLLAADVIDELWLTVCPLLLGGEDAPTPVAGQGFAANLAPRLDLLSVEAIAHEVFLHYRVQHPHVQHPG